MLVIRPQLYDCVHQCLGTSLDYSELPFRSLSHVSERLKPVGGILRPDTASLPTGKGRNNSNIVEIICGWGQLYQCCAQLFSRPRLENETARNSGRIKTLPDGE